ncbi:50S ribosomal protein L23 [Candidatus Woesearchaeota archaeon]|nr:50S ribosomal protein L23 [Candidatus Woesearchaeota archaeon]
MESLKTIKYPLATEKSIRLMEAENKLIFVVDDKATQNDVKKAVEEVFKAKVDKVNTYVMKGKKRAYVKFAKEYPAIDIATNLGLM